jgi:HSP20 family molecular chaperone IbpA
MRRIPITTIHNPADMVPIFEELERLMSAIECRAYQAFEARGQQHGNDLADWFAAEQQVLGAPAADILLLDDRCIVRVALAGFTDREVTILAAPGDLVLRAETNAKANAKMRAQTGARMSAKVMRRFALPSHVDVSLATAELQEGVLTIEAPRVA